MVVVGRRHVRNRARFIFFLFLVDFRVNYSRHVLLLRDDWECFNLRRLEVLVCVMYQVVYRWFWKGRC